MINQHLATEWALLQNQFDSYEKCSLAIKLISIVVVALASMFNSINEVVVTLLLVLWLQDAIWKTFQGRAEVRLLQLEHLLENTNNSDSQAYQFNRQYLANRPSTIGLIVEYLETIPDGPACLTLENKRIEILKVEDNMVKLSRVFDK